MSRQFSKPMARGASDISNDLAAPGSYSRGGGGGGVDKETREERLIRQQYEQMVRKEEKEIKKKERARMALEEHKDPAYQIGQTSGSHPSVLGNQPKHFVPPWQDPIVLAGAQRTGFDDINSLECLQMMAMHHQMGFFTPFDNGNNSTGNYQAAKQPIGYPFSMFNVFNQSNFPKSQNLSQSHFIGQNNIIQTSVQHINKPVDQPNLNVMKHKTMPAVTNGNNSSSDSNKKEIIILDDLTGPIDELSNTSAINSKQPTEYFQQHATPEMAPSKPMLDTTHQAQTFMAAPIAKNESLTDLLTTQLLTNMNDPEKTTNTDNERLAKSHNLVALGNSCLKEKESNVGKFDMKKTKSHHNFGALPGPQNAQSVKQTLNKIQMLKINMNFSDQAINQLNELYFRKVERKEQVQKLASGGSVKERLLQKMKLGKRANSETEVVTPKFSGGSVDFELLRIVEMTNKMQSEQFEPVQKRQKV